MENAADALKIAFVLFVFVVAITITFSVIAQAKSTGDYVLARNDKINYYDWMDSKEENRVVTVADVISTLQGYYNKTISVTVKLGNDEYIFDNGRETIVDEDAVITTNEGKEKNLEKFINDELLKLNSDTKFTEEFVEVPISGIYQRGEDATEIVISSGQNKVYITYTMQ